MRRYRSSPSDPSGGGSGSSSLSSFSRSAAALMAMYWGITADRFMTGAWIWLTSWVTAVREPKLS